MSESGADLTIREATLADTEALQAFAERLFTERPPGIFQREIPTVEQELEFVRGYVEHAGSALLLAERDGEIAGLVSMDGRKLAQMVHVADLGISVDRAHRGEGIGTALLEAAIAKAPELGLRRLEITAFATNTDAIRLYERVGFVREGVKRGDVQIDGVDVDTNVLGMTGLGGEGNAGS